MQKPKKLMPGATIGVISPSSPSETRSEVPRAVEYLSAMGYNIITGRNLNKTKGFVAASEEDRAADLNEMFRRKDIDAVFVTQGGYGAAQLLDLIDFEMIKKNPKIFTGFSDITSLHLMLNKFCDLVTFHGPGMARFNEEDLTEYTKKQFFDALCTDKPLGKINTAVKKKWLYKISGGKAEGQITGGNLTLVCASLGTPYEIDCRDKILFLEEVDAEPWIVDHNMCHLRNSGKLNDAIGFVIGECKNCRPYDYKPGYNCDISLEEVLEYYLKDLSKPVLYGLPLGHTDDIATIPLGVSALLDADSKTLEIKQSGVL